MGERVTGCEWVELVCGIVEVGPAIIVFLL